MNVQGKTHKNHFIISSVIPQLIQIKKKTITNVSLQIYPPFPHKGPLHPS